MVYAEELRRGEVDWGGPMICLRSVEVVVFFHECVCLLGCGGGEMGCHYDNERAKKRERKREREKKKKKRSNVKQSCVGGCGGCCYVLSEDLRLCYLWQMCHLVESVENNASLFYHLLFFRGRVRCPHGEHMCDRAKVPWRH